MKKIKAYPKVNLCLKVYKGMVEGKHRIDSVMFLYKKLYDIIKIKKSDVLYVLYKTNKKKITLTDCLVSRTLKYLNLKYGINTNYYIEIDKRIPFGSGMGGGSADAAAVIFYVLQQNPNIQLDLKEIAVELSSDIPFFLSRYPIARVKDLGQTVSPIYNWQPKIEIKTFDLVVSTKKVFDSLEADEEYVSKVDVSRIISQHLYKQHFINVVYNDLTKYIIQNYRELQDPYKKCGNNSFFTGTGATIVTIKE